ncbi:MAG: fructose-6-phosphate aldolase [Actinobacteria bacterium]|nr:fructose-6-phosphate aldolase [Actinomycetota bacterium]MCG2818393.1 fructose-6-phosphate aldolase [Actinomycetes bacterium]MBU4178962.1 fructose-6-phosphate aldolase [Actinomycetota bacterium]MBU4219981.1 fructose-6-phosphate aldolase [Actinomycetota bacterium]MBU4358327.1 fructose-6-phosphate aldolase [Actinomycetota bacterium]
MRLFIDTANVEHIKEVNGWGVLDGVTTNPSLASKENRNYRECVREIAGIVEGPISAEAVSLDAGEMVSEARELAAIAPNVNVKIPMCPEGLKAIKELSAEGIKTNCTLVFSANQAMLAAAAGATFASPFLGRLDDIGNDGLRLLAEIVEIYEYYAIETAVISASLRHPQHVIGSALTGAHIATIPYKVFQQMARHPLTDIGIERFLADWEKIKHL